ncbi:hypothetical protein RDABS01_000291 [Bienertia sinuspersici]
MSNTNIEIKSKDEVVAIEPNGGIGVWNESIESCPICLIEDEKLKEKKNKDYSQDQVKNKYNQLRAKWKELSKILEEIGIRYNSVTHQLSVEDAIWKKLCELCTIFDDIITTGASSHPSAKSPSDSEDVDDTDGEVGNSEKEGEEGPKAKKSKPNVNPKKT